MKCEKGKTKAMAKGGVVSAPKGKKAPSGFEKMMAAKGRNMAKKEKC